MSFVNRIQTLRVVALVAVLAVVLLLSGGPQTEDGLAQSAPPQERPNIVFVLADDMDTSMIPHMPNLKSLMVDRGMSFDNAFVSNSLCCPSRSTILRGQYSHNHGVLSNEYPLGGHQKFQELGHEGSNISTWLRSGGYQTALFGKYLNGSRIDYRPPGWDEWYGSQAMYTDFRINENGRIVSYAGPNNYQTDVLSDKADAYVRRASGGQKPFFMYVAPSAPHSPSTPARRHEGLFADKTAPRPPSFDEADVSDKPQWVRGKSPLTQTEKAEIDGRYRDSLRSLQAVDEMIKRLTETLQSTGELDNTYIVFTSDNGFHTGQHRLRPGKWTAYEEDIRVPLIVRGPGVSAGQSPDQLVLNNDFAPTFADLAGVSAPSFVDGRSLRPVLQSSSPSGTNWRSGFLQEAIASPVMNGPAAMNRPAYEAVRTTRHLYVEYENGERELYDMQIDPYQLNNSFRSADPALLKTLRDRLAALRACSGQACRDAEGSTAPPPTPDGNPPRSPGSLSLTPSQGGIALNWDDNKETDLAGYNVYRSDSDRGTYAKLNSGLLTTSAYTDADAPQGRSSYYRVTAVDKSGSESSPTSASAFREDTAGPDTTITAGPSGATNDSTPTFTFSASDNVSAQDKLKYSYKVDNGAWSGYSTNKTFTAGGAAGLSQGAHSFEVRAMDEKGNVESSPARREFTVDSAAPETTVAALPSGSQGPSVSLSFSSNEAGSTFECSMDNGPYSACTSPKSYNGLSSGDHVFRMKATDAAGNADATPAERSFTVVADSTPPQTTIDGGPSGPTSDATPTFTYSASDNASAPAGLLYSYKVDGRAWSAYSSNKTVTLGGAGGLAPGPHTIYVKARDEAGNEDASPAQRQFTVDTTPPSGIVSINNGASTTSSRTVTLALSATDPSPGSGVDMMRFRNQDTATWTSWESYSATKSWQLSSGSGTKRVYVQYMDKAGNVSAEVLDEISYR